MSAQKLQKHRSFVLTVLPASWLLICCCMTVRAEHWVHYTSKDCSWFVENNAAFLAVSANCVWCVSRDGKICCLDRKSQSWRIVDPGKSTREGNVPDLAPSSNLPRIEPVKGLPGRSGAGLRVQGIALSLLGLWLGTTSGAYLVLPDMEQFFSFSPGHWFLNRDVLSLSTNGKQLWFGAGGSKVGAGGFLSLSSDLRSLDRFSMSDGTSFQVAITAMAVDNQDLWVAIEKRTASAEPKENTTEYLLGRCHVVDRTWVAWHSLERSCRFIAVGPRSVWFAGPELLGKYTRSNGTWVDFKRPEVSKDWMSDLEINGDLLWLGTVGAGLKQINLHTGRSRIFTTSSGMLSNAVSALCVDGNSLWIASGSESQRGISQWVPND